MPDVLTHYVTSYLISTRFRDEKTSLIIAISGILPDMDALLGMHRWVTHSIPLTLPILLLIYLLMKDKWRDLALITFLYELHLIMDLFTGPTPILWPLIPEAYSINLDLDAILGNKVGLKGFLRVNPSPVNFQVHSVVEGPVISNGGALFGLLALVLLAAERLSRANVRN